MDVHLEGLVVLADDEAVADAVEERAEVVERPIRGLADDEDRVEGEGDVILTEGGEVGLVLRLRLLDLGNGLALQRAEHTLENDEVALAAGVDDARLLEHGVHIDGLFERLIADADRLGQNVLRVVVLIGGLERALGRETGDGQHRTLRGLHDRAVGRGDALLQRGGELQAVRIAQPLEGLGDAAEQQAQDDAGVAARAAQQGRRRRLGRLGDALGLGAAELGDGRLDRQAHVRAGVAVRDGEYVQVVDGLLLLGDTSGAEDNHLLEDAAADSLCHGSVSPSVRRAQTVIESTQTLTSRTSTPVFLVTTYLTSLMMERQTVAILTPFSTTICSSMETVLSSL